MMASLMVAIILAPQGALLPTRIYPIHPTYSTTMLHQSEMAFLMIEPRVSGGQLGCVEASLPTFGGRQLTNIDETQLTNIDVRQVTNIDVRQQTNILVRQQTNVLLSMLALKI